MITQDDFDLRTWLALQCSHRNKVALHRAVLGCRQLLGELQENGKLEGPLLPDRLRVNTRGELRLADPAAPTNGHACLHPGRRSDDDPQAVAFSGLYILVALRALSLHPEWWDERVHASSDHQLLISPGDLRQSSLSELGGRLAENGDPVLRDWSVKLFGLYEQDQEQTPPLTDLAALPDEGLPPPPRAVDPPVADAPLVERLSWAMDHGEAGWFLEWFDAREIRRQKFPYERHSKLGDWVKDYLADNRTVDEFVNNAICDRREWLNVAPRSIELAGFLPPRGERTGYDIAWAWPHPRFAEECLVVVSRDPADRPNLSRIDLNRIEPQTLGPGILDARLWPWDNGQPSTTFHPQPAHADAWVTVWSLIDLGFRRFCSGPLVLGVIERPARPQPWLRRLWRRRAHPGKPQ